jgi:predicted lipoprotein with Yx(FWY)xxD motif
MSLSRTIAVLMSAVFVAAGCGDDGGGADKPSGENEPAAATGPEDSAANRSDKAADQTRSARPGTKVILAGSEFGRMLFNAKKQAIYIFQRDEENKSNCYGECAEAWPPVFTEGRPRAGDGVDSSLLGTTTRRDGKRQVTYAGKPLYYYVNERPGEVRCHNVNLNGGFWWAIGANGTRLQ